MLYPDWDNPITLFTGPFTGPLREGSIPKNGILISYIGANSQLSIGRNGGSIQVARHFVGSLQYNHFVMNTVSVKKGDTWIWINGGGGALSNVILIPYK